jgi:N-methylhydantoinase B
LVTQATIDPITVEIIQSSLQAICDEMFGSIRKTAMSSIIYEVLDMGTGVTDPAGELAASGAGIPGFVGMLDKAVRRIVGLHDPSEIRPGDVFVTNDPFHGGVTHLNDVIFAMPVFAGGELIAWTANIAHWNDVGGMVPGSISNQAREIYQEGLRLPAIKIVDRGRPIRPVIEIMKVNSRLPDFLEGDMWSGISAARLGARRITEIAERYGVETFLTAVRRLMDHGEQVSLTALRDLPRGTFSLREPQDDGSTYAVTVEITGSAFTIDLRDNPDQDPGSYNVCHDATMSAAQMIFKNVTDPQGSANGGSFRPLRCLTRPGSCFDATLPAAFGVYSEIKIRMYDLVWRCLAPHLGDRLPAGHFASVCGTFIGGPHADTGRHFTIVEPQIGGWGGSAARDGNSAQFTGVHGDTFRCPAEIAEARYGLWVEQVALNDEGGGAGRRRGGKGVVVDYRVRNDGLFFTCSFTRERIPPWPLAGGHEGGTNHVDIVRADGTRERHGMATALELNAGDLVHICTANGAGYGDPRERERARVLDDLRNGLIGRDEAIGVYGLDPMEVPVAGMQS